MKSVGLLILSAVLALAPATSSAEWNHKTVGETVDKIKAGKQRVDLRYDYPEEKVQLVSFDVAPKLNYLIDVKAKACYFRWTSSQTAVSMVEVSCKALKDGYPIMAPIIDWEQ